MGREGESWGLDVEKRQPCRNPKIKYFQKTHEPRILKLRTSLVCSQSRRGQSGWRIVNKGKDGGDRLKRRRDPHIGFVEFTKKFAFYFVSKGSCRLFGLSN